VQAKISRGTGARLEKFNKVSGFYCEDKGMVCFSILYEQDSVYHDNNIASDCKLNPNPITKHGTEQETARLVI